MITLIQWHRYYFDVQDKWPRFKRVWCSLALLKEIPTQFPSCHLGMRVWTPGSVCHQLRPVRHQPLLWTHARSTFCFICYLFVFQFHLCLTRREHKTQRLHNVVLERAITSGEMLPVDNCLGTMTPQTIYAKHSSDIKRHCTGGEWEGTTLTSKGRSRMTSFSIFKES